MTVLSKISKVQLARMMAGHAILLPAIQSRLKHNAPRTAQSRNNGLHFQVQTECQAQQTFDFVRRAPLDRSHRAFSPREAQCGSSDTNRIYGMLFPSCPLEPHDRLLHAIAIPCFESL